MNKKILKRVDALENEVKVNDGSPRRFDDITKNPRRADQNLMNFIRYFSDFIRSGEITDLESFRPIAKRWLKENNFYCTPKELDEHYHTYHRVREYLKN